MQTLFTEFALILYLFTTHHAICMFIQIEQSMEKYNQTISTKILMRFYNIIIHIILILSMLMALLGIALNTIRDNKINST